MRARRAGRRSTWLPLGAAALLVPASFGEAEERSRCFDVAVPFDAPLREPIALDGAREQSQHGKRPDGFSWAATRAILDVPSQLVLAKLRDHRNVKDMSKTTLAARSYERPDYFELCHVDVDVRVRALFVKFHLRWTEEWAYRLLAGTRREPELVVINYQKIAGTRHIQHQCGSYVIRRLDSKRTDLFLYEEFRARRRSSRDTRDMHRGILRNIRDDVWPLEVEPAALPALHVLTAAQ